MSKRLRVVARIGSGMWPHRMVDDINGFKVAYIQALGSVIYFAQAPGLYGGAGVPNIIWSSSISHLRRSFCIRSSRRTEEGRETSSRELFAAIASESKFWLESLVAGWDDASVPLEINALGCRDLAESSCSEFISRPRYYLSFKSWIMEEVASFTSSSSFPVPEK